MVAMIIIIIIIIVISTVFTYILQWVYIHYSTSIKLERNNNNTISFLPQLLDSFFGSLIITYSHMELRCDREHKISPT